MTTPATSPAWEELLTAALLGTDRRTPEGVPRGRAAPGALLDAAAAETVRRRAGLRPGWSGSPRTGTGRPGTICAPGPGSDP
ncbi:hypothetical protein AB0B23_26755, partial [Streptomyces antibioticus]